MADKHRDCDERVRLVILRTKEECIEAAQMISRPMPLGTFTYVKMNDLKKAIHRWEVREAPYPMADKHMDYDRVVLDAAVKGFEARGALTNLYRKVDRLASEVVSLTKERNYWMVEYMRKVRESHLATNGSVSDAEETKRRLAHENKIDKERKARGDHRSISA